MQKILLVELYDQLPYTQKVHLINPYFHQRYINNQLQILQNIARHFSNFEIGSLALH